MMHCSVFKETSRKRKEKLITQKKQQEQEQQLTQKYMYRE